MSNFAYFCAGFGMGIIVAEIIAHSVYGVCLIRWAAEPDGEKKDA